jgi:hypothetical protein
LPWVDDLRREILFLASFIIECLPKPKPYSKGAKALVQRQTGTARTSLTLPVHQPLLTRMDELRAMDMEVPSLIALALAKLTAAPRRTSPTLTTEANLLSLHPMRSKSPEVPP